MGLFKEIHCAKCGKKTNMLFRTKLTDGSYLCSDCTSMIPDYMMDSVRKCYSFEGYKSLIDYIDYSNEVLRHVFEETHAYYNIHIDADHGLFYIGKSVNDNTVFLRMRYIDDYNLTFSAEEIKEGTFGDKISGKVLFRIQMGHPIFYHEEILDYGARVKAKKAFFGTEYRYENPRGMDEFMLFFEAAIAADLEVYRASLEDEYDVAEETTELRQAMDMFLIDNLSELTLESLKAQRNRLIKIFHPDATSDSDTKYAQKINSAYEILKEYVEKG